MFRKLVIAIVCIVAAITASAQTESTYRVTVDALDGLTSERLIAKFYVMTPDSVVVDSLGTPISIYTINGVEYTRRYAATKGLRLTPGSEMLLKVTAPGYDTELLTMKVPTGKQREIEMIDIKLYPVRSAIELGEVVVKRSRVKMVLKGDTIVFDAAKFQLNHGDMLAEMVKQMEGLTIEDGVIYMNGRRIDDLLLNGESFFKGDPSVALNNLPAFTVRNIKIYEKAPDSEYITGVDAGEKKDYVLDVTLKKEYLTGYLGNIEGGYGSADRYMGRGFGLAFGPKFRVATYFNVNNIQNVQTATSSSSGDWNARGMGGYGGGEAHRRLAGIDYLYKTGDIKLTGSVDLQHNSQQNDAIESITNFLEGGNTFGRKVANRGRRELRVMTNHNFQLTKKLFFMELKPSLQYNRFNADNRQRNLLYTEEPIERYRGEAIDSAFDASASGRWRQGLLYLNGTRDRSRNIGLNFNLQYNSRIKFTSEATDYLTLAAFLKFDRTEDRGRQFYTLDYPDGNIPATDLDRLSLNRPHSLEYEGCVAYDWRSAPNRHDVVFTLRPYVSFNRKNQDRDYKLYDLQDLAQEAPGGLSIEVTDAIRAVMDRDNSYWWKQDIENAKARVEFTMAKSLTLFTMALRAGMNFRQSTISYTNPDFHERLSRNDVLPEFGAIFRHSYRSDYVYSNGGFEAAFSKENPELTYLVRANRTSDPLQLWENNPDLRSPGKMETELWYSFSPRKVPGMSLSIYGRMQFYFDRTVNSRTYDPLTGVNTLRPVSMNGSRDGSMYSSFNFPIKGNFSGGVSCSLNYERSVDWLNDGTFSGRNVVGSLETAPVISFNYDDGKWDLGLMGSYRTTRNTSDRPGYVAKDKWRVYGGVLRAAYKCPWNMTIHSDVSAYFDRGSSNQSFNQNAWDWTLRISQSFANDRWIATLIGNNLLNRNNRIYKIVSADAATQIWQNTMPRYVMVTLAYKFNYTPKKN